MSKAAVLAMCFISVAYSYDPERREQWYLDDSEDVSLRVDGAWNKNYDGRGVVVGVVDSGISDVPDLRGQVVRHYTKNGNTISSSAIGARGHGTKTAGVISMVKDNRKCGVGIAPGAKLIDIASFYEGNPTNSQKAYSQIIELDNVDIYSNSWGTFDGGITLEDLIPDMKTNLQEGTRSGRGRKGAIYLWAAGNGGINGDSCAYDAYINNLNVAAITGMTRQGRKLNSGESCTAIMAAAPSSNGEQSSSWGFGSSTIDGIVTTDEDNDCTDNYAQSSVAPPMAAGVIALALEAKPSLGWRDVHHLMAFTSNPCAASSSRQTSFRTNGAGFKVSDTFGFGLLNADEMVRAAEGWTNVGSQLRCRATKSGSSITFRTTDIHCDGSDIEFLEHVIVKVTASATNYRGRILATLRSPAGTSSRVLPGRVQDFLPLGLDNWQVKAVTFWGEKVMDGSWSIDLQNVGNVEVSIEFYGLARAPAYSGSKQRCPNGGQPPVAPTAAPTTRWRGETTTQSQGGCVENFHEDGPCSVTCGQGIVQRTYKCRDQSGNVSTKDIYMLQCDAGSCSSSGTCSFSVLISCQWNPTQRQYIETVRKSCPGREDAILLQTC